MKDVVRLLFSAGVAIVAFGLAPQVSAQNAMSCPPEIQKEMQNLCGLATFEYMRLENILNTDKVLDADNSVAVSFCVCPDVTIEYCTDSVCSNIERSKALAADASRVSYGDGIEGSTCRKETICFPSAGGSSVCPTVVICKD